MDVRLARGIDDPERAGAHETSQHGIEKPQRDRPPSGQLSAALDRAAGQGFPGPDSAVKEADADHWLEGLQRAGISE